jgi:hypothetical protein
VILLLFCRAETPSIHTPTAMSISRTQVRNSTDSVYVCDKQFSIEVVTTSNDH